jgi:hypothetical protein
MAEDAGQGDVEADRNHEERSAVTNVIPIPFRPMRQGDGGGPDNPALEQRVVNLQEAVARIEAKITEMLVSGAKQADVLKVQLEIAELKGRFSGLEARLGALPSTATLLAIVFTTWALGSGILIFALNVLRR